MDAKALAKSKRAHSLHHSKKHHPNPTSKATPGLVTATGGKKPTNKQERDKPHQSQVSKVLPSNWDRYEEEFDSGSEDISQVSTSRAPDVVRPKSKGADYAYLISEAKAQSQANSSSESLGFYDDILDGFSQGLSPLLSVKGQRMVSWISDDNFLLDDKGTTTGHEASFLSLNLHSLAEQLSKATLAERLFIEPDLLPQDTGTDLQSSNVKLPDETQARDSTEVTVLDEQASTNTTKEKRNLNLSGRDMSSDSSRSIHTSPPTSINHPVDDLWKINETSGSTSGKLTSDLYTDSVAKKPSRFEAAEAEAELDMLLGSLNETQFFDSTSITQQSSHKSHKGQASSMQSVPVPKQHVKELGGVDSSLDDILDDLLKDTSSATNTKGVSSLHEVKAASHDAPSASQSHSKSKILDDFDSWLDTI